MTLLAYPLAAMGGALAGAVVHEGCHAVAAVALGELVGAGWRGGVSGGPYVDFRAPTRTRTQVILKAPLVVGVVAAVVAAVTVEAITPTSVAVVAGLVTLLLSSPEDIWAARSRSAADS